MKNHLIISLLILSVGFSQQEYDGNDIIEMDNGLWSVKFSDEPITGKVYGNFGKEGEELTKVYIGKLINGEKDGKWTFWFHNTGTKQYEATYKDGELDGLWTWWYENGQKDSEGTYKDGERISEQCWDRGGYEIDCP